MSFKIVTDTSANLPSELLRRQDIAVVPLSYIADGEEYTCTDTASFDEEGFYGAMKAGKKITTSQITPQTYVDALRPLLQQGQDVVFVGMSSGISGSFHSAELASGQLREEFPQRTLLTFDTLAASLGEGISVLHAIRCRDEGMTPEQTVAFLLSRRSHVCQLLMLDDLMHLRRGGRISSAKAVIGTVLGIKPLLKGNPEGQLVVTNNIRGRNHAIAALAARYDALVDNAAGQTVGIAYADCREDAEALAQMLRRTHPPKEIMTVCYEPVTGSHVGPGALALFFEGKENVRTL